MIIIVIIMLIIVIIIVTTWYQSGSGICIICCFAHYTYRYCCCCCTDVPIYVYSVVKYSQVRTNSLRKNLLSSFCCLKYILYNSNTSFQIIVKLILNYYPERFYLLRVIGVPAGNCTFECQSPGVGKKNKFLL